jgi:hypothetical protein
MRIVIVRSAEAHCEPHCVEWVSAEGDIVPGTAAEFSRALRLLGNRRLPVLVASRGGAVEDALAIGRMIRARNLDVAVARTRFASCRPDDSACQKNKDFKGFIGSPEARLALCASACAYLFAGGINRYVGFGAFVGLHQSTNKRTQVLILYRVTTRHFPDGRTETTKTVTDRHVMDMGSAAQTSEQEYKNVIGYLDEMGVASKEFLDIVVATPASTIHWMTPTELLTTNLSTDRHNGEYLIATAAAAAREAYLASPEYRTISYAYALLPLGMFGQRETMLALNFSHRKNTSEIDLTATPSSEGALLPTTPIEVDLHWGADRTFAALNSQTRQVYEPLQTTIPVAAFCELASDSMIKVGMEQNSPGGQNTTLYTDARRFIAMDALLADACKN